MSYYNASTPVNFLLTASNLHVLSCSHEHSCSHDARAYAGVGRLKDLCTCISLLCNHRIVLAIIRVMNIDVLRGQGALEVSSRRETQPTTTAITTCHAQAEDGRERNKQSQLVR